MTGNITVSMVLLVIILFATGCGQQATRPAEVQPTQIEPAKTAPPVAEPCEPEAATPEPPKEQPAPQIPTEPVQAKKLAAPDANAQQKVQTSTANVFADNCAEILKNCVDDKGMVNYKMLKKKKLELKKILDDLRSINPNEYKSWSKEDKIAFWLNTYNMQMLRIITDNYPIESTRMLRLIWPPDSIRHITGIWDQYKFIVMDEEFTLAEIDQQFFREEFNEPRMFLAVMHASLSSPPLRNEPYYGDRLSQQFDDQAKKFLSNPLAFKIDREKQKVYLSAIFEPGWYGQYFVGNYGTDKKFKDYLPAVRAVLNFIANYIPKTDAYYLETGNYYIEYMRFNWRLNEHVVFYSINPN